MITKKNSILRANVLALALLLFMGCGASCGDNKSSCSDDSSKDRIDKQESRKEVGSIESEIETPERYETRVKQYEPFHWSEDKAYCTNPQLVRLIDTLYNHVMKEPPLKGEEEMEWMRAYQKRICAFYDRCGLWDKGVSDYAKVDSVLNYLTSIYDFQESPSNDQMYYNNLMDDARATFKDYAVLFRMQELCRSPKEMELLMAEWESWKKLEKTLAGFWANIVDLTYFGGSAAKVVRSYGYSRLAEAHNEMYEKEIAYRQDRHLNISNGRVPECVEEWFYKCCNAALDSCSHIGENVDDAKNIYQETIEKKEALKYLSAEWIRTRNEWIDEVSSGSGAELHKNISFEVFSKWSVLLSLADLPDNLFG